MYRLYRNLSNVYLYKESELVFCGTLDMGFSAYGFKFYDSDENIYHMRATGMFFWRKISLYKNDVFVERYKRRCAQGSNVRLKEYKLRLILNRKELTVLKKPPFNNSSFGVHFTLWTPSPT
jgi:hypothetical protein